MYINTSEACFICIYVYVYIYI